MAARFNLQDELDEPEGLECFPPGRSRLFRYAAAVGSHLEQFGLPRLVTFAAGQLFAQIRIPMGVGNSRFIRNDDGIVEITFLHIFRRSTAQFRFLRFRFTDDAAEAFTQDFSIIDADMTDTVEIVVANSEDAIGLGIEAGLGHVTRSQIARRLARPV